MTNAQWLTTAGESELIPFLMSVGYSYSRTDYSNYYDPHFFLGETYIRNENDIIKWLHSYKTDD